MSALRVSESRLRAAEKAGGTAIRTGHGVRVVPGPNALVYRAAEKAGAKCAEIHRLEGLLRPEKDRCAELYYKANRVRIEHHGNSLGVTMGAVRRLSAKADHLRDCLHILRSEGMRIEAGAYGFILRSFPEWTSEHHVLAAEWHKAQGNETAALVHNSALWALRNPSRVAA